MDEQSDPRFLVGQVLADRYWLQEHLGRGAMGDVFRARHAKVPRTFAIKVLHPELVADPKVCARFEREAELAGRLHHRNVISVIDVGETTRSRYLVMEYAEGISLVDLIGGEPLPTSRVVNIAKQICDGLQHAHENGLVHRDLKPENIIVERTGDDEVPRIVDFGLAILRDGVSDEERDRLTTRGIVLGTPHYLAPETALGGVVDHRIDLFALGVILYEMVTGKMPFDGDGVQVARANLHTATPAMGTRVPGLEVDPLLEALVGKLLEKRPDDRPQTAREVRSLLDLIDKDRRQAAYVLGLGERQRSDRTARAALASAPPAAVIPVVEASPRPTGNGVPLERESSAEVTSRTEEAWFEGAEPASPNAQRTITTDQVAVERVVHATDEVEPQPRSRRRAVVIGAFAGLLGALLLFLALRDDSTQAVAAADDAPPVTALVMEATPPPTPTAVVPVVAAAEAPAIEAATDPVSDPVTVHARTPARPRPTTTTPVAAITTAALPTSEETPAPPPADVIEMYQRLGRKLKAIADRRDMAADDLWVRYRLVRIQDVYASAAKRTQYVSILSGIDDELKRRFPAP